MIIAGRDTCNGSCETRAGCRCVERTGAAEPPAPRKQRDRDIVLTLLIVLGAPAAAIGIVNLIVWAVKP